MYFYVATGRLVRLNVSPGTSGNTYGHFDQDPVSGVHNTIFIDGTLDQVVYNTDGTIQIVIGKEKLGVSSGDQLLSVYADSQPGESVQHHPGGGGLLRLQDRRQRLLQAGRAVEPARLTTSDPRPPLPNPEERPGLLSSTPVGARLIS